MVKRALFIFTVFLATFSCILPHTVYPEVLILKSGSRIEGEIIEETDEYVRIDFYGAQLTYYRTDIERIVTQEAEGVPAVSSPEVHERTAHEEKPLQPAPTTCLWQVRSPENTLHVLGSIHLARKDMYPLPLVIEYAFEEADILAVEVNIDDDVAPQYQKTLLERGTYPSGETLRDFVTNETFDNTAQKLEEFSIPIQQVTQYKPWYLALVLTKMELEKLGYQPEYGIDNYFLKKAKEIKEIQEVESWQYQIGLFEGLSRFEQKLFLDYVLKYLDMLEADMDMIVSLWDEGNTRELDYVLFDKWLTEVPELAPLYEKLFYERNRNMAGRIEEFLASGKKYFVVVGVGHLVGDKGVVALLKERGYTVIQK